MRIIFRGLSAIMVFFVLLFLILQFSLVQTTIAKIVAAELNKGWDFSVKIDKVSISWLDEAEFINVSVTDPDQNQMINVKDIKLDFNLVSLIWDDQIQQDLIILNEPTVLFTPIKVNDSTYSFNYIEFIKHLRKPSKKKKVKDILIQQILAKNASFSYQNTLATPLSRGLDPNYFTFEKAAFQIDHFAVIGNEIEMDISDFSTFENSIEMEVNSLFTHFKLTPHSLALTDLEAKTGQTTLKDSIVFSFNSLKSFTTFWDSVYVDAKINNSLVYREDLQKFFPWATQIPSSANITGEFSGLLSDFDFNNFNVSFGNSTHFNGNMSISGLPLIGETFLNIDLTNSQVNLNDLESITTLKRGQYPDLGNMTMNGNFLGYLNDFVAFGNFQTIYGRIRSDINLKIPDKGKPGYSGKLNLQNFNIGKMLEIPDLTTLNFNGEVSGEGFSIKSAKLYLDGTVTNMNYKGYRYEKIYSNGNLANEYFEGILKIEDPNLNLDLNGTIDMVDNNEIIDVSISLDTVNLKSLKLNDEEFSMKGYGELELTGLDPDNLEGVARLKDVHMKTEKNELHLDTVYLLALKNEDVRSINFKSEIIETELVGNYRLSTIFKELNTLYIDYIAILNKDSLHNESQNSYTIKGDSTQTPNVFDYEIKIKDINSFFDLFFPTLKVSDNTSISGNYQGGNTQIFNVSVFCDTLAYENYEFYNNNLEINSSKIDKDNILAMMYLESEGQNLSGIISENLLAEAIWEKEHIDFDLNLDQSRFNNHLNLPGHVDIGRDTTLITFLNSEIKLLDKPWQLSRDGKIYLSKDNIYIENIETKSTDQGLSMNGFLTSDPEKSFTVEFDSLELENFNSLINKKLSGKLDGDIFVTQFFGNTSIENDLTITDFHINDFKVGDVAGKLLWDRINKRFDVGLSVDYENEVTMELKGFYEPEKEENSLDIDAELVNAQVHILEPFIGSYFSEISGTATGDFKITGTPLSPEVFGKGFLNNGEMTVNYLNTTYLVAGDFSFSEDLIFLDDINVRDNYVNGKGLLRGEIDHGGFRSMAVDLYGSFEGLHVLNTTMKDNSLFYGQGISSGDITFKGPVSNMSIETNLKTERGTRIYIPLEGTEYAETSEFISFVDFSDTLQTRKQEIEAVDIKGVLLEMDIEITPEAYCEIIFDIKAGDIIRGRGNGDLSLRIDSNGEFSMFGPLQITEGWYNFTLYNIINKEFIIQPGGMISWFGDPYGGIMDLKAMYDQNVSFYPLVQDDVESSGDLNRKYPSQVVMDLQGPLMNPEISFDIFAPNLPRNVTAYNENGRMSVDLDFEFQSYKNEIDEQELKKQIFSLIVLKRFSSPNAFNAEGAISNSVSELFSNQLSYWMSQVDSNLEVDFDVDLSKLDEEAFNTFQLRLSYAFMDGRLRITRDGGFTDNQRQVNINSLAGNWSVEYLLTPDGKLRAKMYNKNNFDNFDQTNRTSNNTTGFSLQYTKSFDEFLKEMGRIFTNSNEENQQEPDAKIPPSSDAKIEENEL